MKQRIRLVAVVLAFVFGSNPAHAVVVCGKDWITFTAEYRLLHTEETRKKDNSDPMYQFRYLGRFTFPKSRFVEIESFYVDGKHAGWGTITIKNRQGSYAVTGQDYYEVIGCLD